MSDRATDEELASRIATFIWGAAPDAALLEVARQGKLHDPRSGPAGEAHAPDPGRSISTGFFEPKFNLDNLDKASPILPSSLRSISHCSSP
jgi:hypothetical protein